MSGHGLTAEQVVARDALVREHLGTAYRYARQEVKRSGCLSTDAEGAAHEGLVVAARDYVLKGADGPFEAWVRVAVRRCVHEDIVRRGGPSRWTRRRIGALGRAGHHPSQLTTVEKVQAASVATGMTPWAVADAVMGYWEQRPTTPLSEEHDDPERVPVGRMSAVVGMLSRPIPDTRKPQFPPSKPGAAARMREVLAQGPPPPITARAAAAGARVHRVHVNPAPAVAVARLRAALDGGPSSEGRG